MTNLLEETKEDIRSSKHTQADVAWVGSRDGRFAVSWEAFTQMANIEYDSGYGGQEVADDLVVVFTDGSWLERSEYDGAEGWRFCRTPVMKDSAQGFETVRNNDYWKSRQKRPVFLRCFQS